MRDKVFNTAKNPKYDVYQRHLPSIVYIFFDKKTEGGAIKNENMSNKELAKELYKPIIKNFGNPKVYPSFIHNIWGANLAAMQLISKFNQRICFYYVLLIFSANAHGLFL